MTMNAFNLLSGIMSPIAPDCFYCPLLRSWIWGFSYRFVGVAIQ